MKYEVKQPKTGYHEYCKVCNKKCYSKRGFEVRQKLEQDLTNYTSVPEKDMNSSFEKFVFPMISSVYPNLVTNGLYSIGFVCSEVCANMYVLQQI